MNSSGCDLLFSRIWKKWKRESLCQYKLFAIRGSEGLYSELSFNTHIFNKNHPYTVVKTTHTTDTHSSYTHNWNAAATMNNFHYICVIIRIKSLTAPHLLHAACLAHPVARLTPTRVSHLQVLVSVSTDLPEHFVTYSHGARRFSVTPVDAERHESAFSVMLYWDSTVFSGQYNAANTVQQL